MKQGPSERAVTRASRSGVQGGGVALARLTVFGSVALTVCADGAGLARHSTLGIRVKITRQARTVQDTNAASAQSAGGGGTCLATRGAVCRLVVVHRAGRAGSVIGSSVSRLALAWGCTYG
eukprot:202428-Hanusia_phi.AAC.1